MWKGPQALSFEVIQWNARHQWMEVVHSEKVTSDSVQYSPSAFPGEKEGEGDSTLKRYSEPESTCPLNQLETALEMTCFSALAVKLIKPWTPEIFLECLSCYDYSHWRSGHASRPQSHNHCCSQFSIPTPDWLLPCSTVTFNKYFWCSVYGVSQ